MKYVYKKKSFMKRLIPVILFLFVFKTLPIFSQVAGDTAVYLITCSPGTETYSIWGHSAIRVVINQTNTDDVYNWGVFDFATKNFAWKFAKGRLNYMLGVYPYDRFLQSYMLENRSVWIQKVNLKPVEKLRLMLLVQENLRPENRTYRYDFFEDNCSTRIRDLLEKIYGNKLIYPPDDMSNAPTFRDKIREYQRNYPWLTMGTDLLIGTPAERKTTFRERMFLPYDLQGNLTQSVINRDRRMEPLLGPIETIFDYPPPENNSRFYTSPMFIFSFILILVIIISAVLRKPHIINYIDIAVFLIFSILAALMIFFNFLTDHVQTRMNINIIWFNPAIIICLFLLIFGKQGTIWFRIVFLLSLSFIPAITFFPGGINSDFVPVVVILILRSSARSDFSWNPFSV
jgi:hypothetical protein